MQIENVELTFFEECIPILKILQVILGVHDFNSNTWEAEDSRVQDQPGLYSETLSQEAGERF
jgi:hypothetical protein